MGLHPSRHFPGHTRPRHFARSGWPSRPPSMHRRWEAGLFASWVGLMSLAAAECPAELNGGWATRADGQLPTPSSCRVQSGSPRTVTFPQFMATACLALMRLTGSGTQNIRRAAQWIDGEAEMILPIASMLSPQLRVMPCLWLLVRSLFQWPHCG